MQSAAEPDRFLPDDLRDKYALTVAEKGSTWVVGGAALLLLLVFNLIEPPLWLGILLLLLGVAAAHQAYTRWRKTRVLAATGDALLEVRYREYSNRKRLQRVIGGALVVLVVAALLFSEDMRQAASRFLSTIGGRAECSIVKVEEDVIVTENGFDAGYKIVTRVKSPGRQRTVEIFAVLSSSEGEFRRDQRLVIGADETRTLVYRFHEPSLNATNIQGRVGCS